MLTTSHALTTASLPTSISPPIHSFFFFNDTATTEIYTLSLHDALPISFTARGILGKPGRKSPEVFPTEARATSYAKIPGERDRKSTRLNSSHGYISYAVFCLKKKNKLKWSVAAWFCAEIVGMDR